MSAPGSKLLTMMLVFIGGTVCAAALRSLHAPGIVLGSLVGSMAGWVAARWLLRRLF